MTKEKYMALSDLQTVWTNKIKPKIPEIAGVVGFASTQEGQQAIAELT